jgi:hypothetical protein
MKKPETEAARRAARSAAALKANIARRKRQAKERARPEAATPRLPGASRQPSDH